MILTSKITTNVIKSINHFKKISYIYKRKSSKKNKKQSATLCKSKRKKFYFYGLEDHKIYQIIFSALYFFILSVAEDV